jgi:thiamine pyrophosphate-dependent acetolactate synthase large subunit-like protein
MGSAAMIGLGLAKTRPDDRILVVTGDGELTMGLGALATIAVQRPKNLSIVVLDNGQFGETGAQTSHTGHGIALDRVAESVGFDRTTCITDLSEIEALRANTHAADALTLAVLKIAAGEETRVMPSRDGVEIKNRFRAALGVL